MTVIKPNMATMLGFLATDADVAQPLLDALVKEAADASFNSITVDGDTSTNDSFILMATGQAGNPTLSDSRSADDAAFRAAVLDLSIWLAQAIVRDGDGATKFITLRIEGGRSREECRKVGYAIGHSPLVKTAFFASDPNLGRILAAIGYAESMIWTSRGCGCGWGVPPKKCWWPKTRGVPSPIGKRRGPA